MNATIIIHDETNCKVEGLSVKTRRTLANRFKFEVPYARHLPSVKLGRWDGRIAFFQLSGTTYVNLLPEIVDVLINEGYELELSDRRSYNRSFEFGLVEEGFFDGVVWPRGHLHEGKPVLLRDYQVGVINSLLANPEAILVTHQQFKARLIKNKEYFHSPAFENLLLDQILNFKPS
jgi:hypothetical protein